MAPYWLDTMLVLRLVDVDGIGVGWRMLMQNVDLPAEMRYGQADTLLLGTS